MNDFYKQIVLTVCLDEIPGIIRLNKEKPLLDNLDAVDAAFKYLFGVEDYTSASLLHTYVWSLSEIPYMKLLEVINDHK